MTQFPLTSISGIWNSNSYSDSTNQVHMQIKSFTEKKEILHHEIREENQIGDDRT
uniref:Uncharacterized protein n=1 Tax=Rhizophora mucronata TaxID=61149 RepID=A0A2P2IKN1_RHIMU